MARSEKIFIAKEPATFDVDGKPYWIAPGTTVRDGHPMLADRMHLFRPFTVDYEWGAEPPRPPDPKDKGDETAPASGSRADSQGARSRSGGTTK